MSAIFAGCAQPKTTAILLQLLMQASCVETVEAGLQQGREKVCRGHTAHTTLLLLLFEDVGIMDAFFLENLEFEKMEKFSWNVWVLSIYGSQLSTVNPRKRRPNKSCAIDFSGLGLG
jgi:hypothetical protein